MTDKQKRPRGRPRKNYILRCINIQPDVNAWLINTKEQTGWPINEIVNAVLRGYFIQRRKQKETK